MKNEIFDVEMLRRRFIRPYFIELGLTVGQGQPHILKELREHRLSTVRNSNAIMVLEKGEIIERGSHDELLEQKGRYYQLYTGQFELE